MTNDAVVESGVAPRRARTVGPVRAAALAVAAAALVVAPLVAGGATAPALKSARVVGYPGALVNVSSRSLYVLTSERGAKLKCVGSCLSVWPPLLVNKSVTHVTIVGGKGHVGFVARSKTMKQVTYNSFPLYTFSGDRGALGHAGVGIAAFGGVWYLVRAAATTPAATPYKKVVKGPKTTTTTTKGSYGGY